MGGKYRWLRGKGLREGDPRCPVKSWKLCFDVFVEVAACLPLGVIVESVGVASYQSSIAVTIVVTTTRRIVWALRIVFGVTCSAWCGVVTAARVDDSSFSVSAQGVREESVQHSLAQARSWRGSENLSRWLVVLRALTLGVRTSGRRSVVIRVQRLRKPSLRLVVLRALTLGVRRRNDQWSIVLRGLTSVLASPGNVDLLLW
jgi:hypothetical protein